jgi:hypothetical protein
MLAAIRSTVCYIRSKVVLQITADWQVGEDGDANCPQMRGRADA